MHTTRLTNPVSLLHTMQDTRSDSVTDLPQLAKALTPAQRDAVRNALDDWGVFGTRPFRNKLAELGLCCSETRAGRGSSCLTPLGLALHDHLTTNGERQ